ncbi:unnamed protein product [Moneuplotes crassus]|uniref:Uncharacterized protein n=1 Tax=Euplotes crassus TaxID=5936 RepID=A0AAD1XCR8_EUPCR|nr:unnamed protein product [Moneuplotes crassus]
MKDINFIDDDDDDIQEELIPSSESYSDQFERFQNPVVIIDPDEKVKKNPKAEKLYKKYNQDLAESISMAIMDETNLLSKKKDSGDSDSINDDSIDSFEEYIGSKFGTSLVKSGQDFSKSHPGMSKSHITEIIDYSENKPIEEISEPTFEGHTEDIIDEVDPPSEDNLYSTIKDEIDPSENDEYASDFHSLEDSQANEIPQKQFKKFVKTKTKKTRPGRVIREKELVRPPDYDLRTLERRFIQQKFNKIGTKLYNQDEAKDYRKLESNFNLEMLNLIKKKIKTKKENPGDEHDCCYCKTYKLKDIRYPMEKIKPLWDDIYLKRPLFEVDEEEEKKKDLEIQALQEKVNKFETKDFIALSINKAIHAKLNPGFGDLP